MPKRRVADNKPRGGTNWTERIDITSTTDPDKKYVLAWNADKEEWGCSCMRWRMARNGVRDCKHVRAVSGLTPQSLGSVEQGLAAHGIGTDFGRQITSAKEQLLAAGYLVEDAADELRLQQEAEFAVDQARGKA